MRSATVAAIAAVFAIAISKTAVAAAGDTKLGCKCKAACAVASGATVPTCDVDASTCSGTPPTKADGTAFDYCTMYNGVMSSYAINSTSGPAEGNCTCALNWVAPNGVSVKGCGNPTSNPGGNWCQVVRTTPAGNGSCTPQSLGKTGFDWSYCNLKDFTDLALPTTAPATPTPTPTATPVPSASEDAAAAAGNGTMATDGGAAAGNSTAGGSRNSTVAHSAAAALSGMHAVHALLAVVAMAAAVVAFN